MLTASRSAAARIWKLRLVSSGTSRRRPNIVFTTPVARAFVERAIDERADAREAGEVGVDELLRRLLRDADVLRQRERRLSVEQRVVDHLRARCAARAGRGRCSAPKTFSAVRSWMSSPLRNASISASSPGEVREHAQLDLRVVGRDQHVAGLGDERARGSRGRARCGSGCSAGSDRCCSSGRSRRPPG